MIKFWIVFLVIFNVAVYADDEREYTCKLSSSSGSKLDFSFIVNLTTGTSSMTGASRGHFDTEYLNIRKDTINLLMISYKRLMTLTIANNGYAVHSRHDIFSMYNKDHLSGSQYTGKCTYR